MPRALSPAATLAVITVAVLALVSSVQGLNDIIDEYRYPCSSDEDCPEKRPTCHQRRPNQRAYCIAAGLRVGTILESDAIAPSAGLGAATSSSTGGVSAVGVLAVGVLLAAISEYL